MKAGEVGGPLRVFLSHTSDLGRPTETGSFVACAAEAVRRARHALTDMAYFAARDASPADYCTAMVAESDVYVGIIGLRYGEPVRDRPSVSYTELEFEAAGEHGRPRLIFLIREGFPHTPPANEPPELRARQDAFRAQLLDARLTAAWVDSPAELELALYQALVELGAATEAPARIAQPVTWPVWVGVLPREADCYQSRVVTGSLSATTSSGGTAVLCQILTGLGGVGKTQLAAARARQLWQASELDLMVWVHAASRSAIVDGYAKAHAAVTGMNVPDTEQAASGLLAWLASTERRWLIVLDDLTDPGDLSGLWPPNAAGGRTVVTTRRRDAALAGAGRTLIDVGIFTQAEAHSYLAARLAARSDLASGAAELARHLSYLPLALAQATTFLIDRGLTCAQYSVRFNDRRRRLSELLPEPGSLPDDYKATVAAIWSLSIELADSLNPPGLAQPTLELASLLAPEGIPEVVFTTEAATRWLSDSTGREVDVESARDALRCLCRLSLATLDQADGVDRLFLGETGWSCSLRVHALVQRAVRDDLHPVRSAHAALSAADAIVEAWPDYKPEWPHRDPIACGALRRSVATLMSGSADTLWMANSGRHRVLFLIGDSLGEDADYAAAVRYYTQLRCDSLRVLGPDHPDTLATRDRLARWQGAAGDVGGAAAAFEELLSDRLRLLGPDNVDTLDTRYKLIYWQGKAGDAGGAAVAFLELLSDSLRVLGPDHDVSLMTRNNLAYLRAESGDAAGAAEAFEELLSDQLRVLGPDHHRTREVRNSLAHCRGEAADAAGAAAAYEVLLSDQLRVLGADHLSTHDARMNLIRWRGEAGDARWWDPVGPADVTAAYKELLRVVGPDHPATLTMRASLARWRGEAEDAGAVVAAYKELLNDSLRVLGPDHRDTLMTLITRSSLASWQGRAEGATVAVAAFKKLLNDSLRVLGPNHRNTLMTRNNLAHWRGEAGDAGAAAAAYKELLSDQLRVLGPDHPDILHTRGELAYWRREAGNAGDAVGTATQRAWYLADWFGLSGGDF